MRSGGVAMAVAVAVKAGGSGGGGAVGVCVRAVDGCELRKCVSAVCVSCDAYE